MLEASGRPGRKVRLNAVLLAAAAVLLAAMYAPVAAGLVRQWVNDDNYRHGFLVPIVSAFILWRKRKELSGAPGGKESLGLLILLVSAGLLVAGTAAAELFTTRISFPLMLLGTFLFLRGAGFTRTAAPPLLFLLLMVPLPYIIYYKVTFPMQLLSAKLSAGALSASGISVIRRGNILVLPNYTLEVVAACSGLRSVMTMFALASVMALISDISPGKKIALLIMSVPVAVAANTVRLVVTGMGAYFAGAAFADGPLHEASGLIVFLTGLLMLLACAGILRWMQYRQRRS